MTPAERLEELLNSWEDAREQGEAVTVEDLCRQSPELIEPLRRRIWLLYPETLVGESALSVSSHTSIRAGRFESRRLLAVGGQSEVFVATDTELNRDVALKRLQPGHGSSHEAHWRFLQEANVTSLLEHPGVVPVYGLSRDAEGRSYLAMRLFSGKTFDDAIAQYHREPSSDRSIGARVTEFHRLVRAFLSVCDVIAFAHSRGIVHRDLKPGNILLGNFGEVLVIDWGLAKSETTPDKPGSEQEFHVAAPSAGPEDTTVRGGTPLATAAGDIKGTPAYMSPEQARGETTSIGPATDIYSLGATLYKLLTGRAPFHGATLSETLARVREGNAPVPRSVDPQAPAALEAISVKAMQRDTANRYGAVRELADDIEHWLADEPVSAWREPWFIRLRRWTKRHRLVLTGMTAAICVGIVALGIIAASEHHKNQALLSANLDLKNAQLQTEQNYQRARETTRKLARAIYQTYLIPGSSVLNLPKSVAAAPETEVRLRELREAYEELVAQHADDVESRANLASVWQLLGVVYDERGRPQEAQQALSEARRRYESIRNLHPDRFRVPFGLAIVDVTEAEVFRKAKDSKQALARLERAAGSMSDLSKQHPEELGLQFGLAEIWNQFGTIVWQQGKPADAITYFERARDLHAELKKRDPDRTAYSDGEARNDFGVGACHSDVMVDAMQAGDLSPAMESFQKATAILRYRVDHHPNPAIAKQTYETHLRNWFIVSRERAAKIAAQGEVQKLLQFVALVPSAWNALEQQEQKPQFVDDEIDRSRISLAGASRAIKYDSSKPAEMQDLRTVLKVGLEALDRLPSAKQKTDEIEALRADLRRRLAEIE